MNRPAHRPFALLVGLALGLAPTAAWAQGAAPSASSAADGSRAVALAQEGRTAYDAGRFDEAYERFAAAQSIAASPTFELYMARARRGALRLVEARVIYLRITSAPVPEGAPAIWAQADADARAELAALAAQVPSIVIEAYGAPDDAVLTLDGRPARAGESIDVDPGEHAATLTQGGRIVKASATVRAGERGVRVQLVWDGAASSRVGATEPPKTEGTDGSIVPGVIGLAVGGGLLAVGAVLGVVALGTDSDVVGACPGGACGPDVDVASVRDDQASAGSLADVSTVMLIAGGVVATAGIVLLVVRPGGSDGPTTSAALGPGGLVLRGGF